LPAAIGRTLILTVGFPDLFAAWGPLFPPLETLSRPLVPTVDRRGIIWVGDPGQTMQILDKIPQLAPQVLMRAPRGIWLLTAALIALFLALQRTGLVIPIPFLLLLITVAVSGALAGALAGAMSGVLMSGFIIYSWATGYGPDALTGDLVRALLGCTVSTALGIYLGVIRDQLVSSYVELQTKRKELALFGEELSRRVRTQTRDLEGAQDELLKQQKRLQSVTQRWIDTQEIERHNLARDLHDDVGQILTALRISLDSGRRAAEPDSPAAMLLGNSTALVDTAIDSIRQLSFKLRPSLIDDLGLMAALREHISRLFRGVDIEIELSQEGDDSRIGPETAITLFRIFQEAIANVLKHADARRVTVHVSTDEEALRVEISDDGRGFDIAADRNLGEHLGLASMQERATLAGGSMSIDSESGGGTRVRVCLPHATERSAA
jgi:signal transduction histidine kinase